MKIAKKMTITQHVMLEEYDMLSHAPMEIQVLVLEGITYLVKNGYVVESTFIFPQFDDKVVIARIGGKPIGYITYSMPEWKRITFVGYGYVVQDARNRGVYKKMFQKLNDLSHAAKRRTIAGVTHMTNKPMQEVMGSLNRKPMCIDYIYEVVPPAAPRKSKKDKKKGSKK